MKSRTSKKSLEQENPKFLKQQQRMTNIGVEEKKKGSLENINTSAFGLCEEWGALSAPRTVNITAAAVLPCRRLARRLFCVVIKLRKLR